MIDREIAHTMPLHYMTSYCMCHIEISHDTLHAKGEKASGSPSLVGGGARRRAPRTLSARYQSMYVYIYIYIEREIDMYIYIYV